jgi:hypothetical protein
MGDLQKTNAVCIRSHHLHPFITMFRFLICALSLAVFMAVARADQHGDDEETTPMGEEMSAMNKAWRTIKKNAADANQNEATLKLLDDMIKAAVTATDMDPVLADEQPEADRQAFIDAFRKAMKATLADLESLRAVLVSGENDKAAALIKKIDDQKKQGHKEFKPKDD